MSRLRVGVVGAGHLGRIHARLLASMEDVELTAVVDPVLSSAEKTAAEHGAWAFADHREIVDLVDAAVVAAPTAAHHAVGMDLLEAGVHLLIEKPLARTAAEAEELCAAAEKRGLALQVGHIERFNPALIAARRLLDRPQYIDATRTSGYTFRSTDIGVVLDLMIHDIDLALTLAESEVERAEALGVSLLGKHEDMAQARLTFANGCVANLTASRASYAAQRRMQIFAAGAFAALDFSVPAARIVRPRETIVRGGFDPDALDDAEKQSIRSHLFHDYLPLEDLRLPRRNALLDELSDFTASVRWGCAPAVDGRQGLAAIAVAEQVLAAIAAHRWNSESGHLCGPLVQPQPHEPTAPPSQPPAPRRKAG